MSDSAASASGSRARWTDKHQLHFVFSFHSQAEAQRHLFERVRLWSLDGSPERLCDSSMRFYFQLATHPFRRQQLRDIDLVSTTLAVRPYSFFLRPHLYLDSDTSLDLSGPLKAGVTHSFRRTTDRNSTTFKSTLDRRVPLMDYPPLGSICPSSNSLKSSSMGLSPSHDSHFCSLTLLLISRYSPSVAIPMEKGRPFSPVSPASACCRSSPSHRSHSELLTRAPSCSTSFLPSANCAFTANLSTPSCPTLT